MSELSVNVELPRGHMPPMAGSDHESRAKVTARDLNFYYGDFHALKHINIVLGENRVTAADSQMENSFTLTVRPDTLFFLTDNLSVEVGTVLDCY